MTTIPRPSTLGRNRDFHRFWFGETASLLGTQVTTLALPLTAILSFGASDRQVGLQRFLQLAPYLGLALIFGVWVDRARRRRVMLGANLTRMVLLALIPVLHYVEVLDLTLLLVIACAIGVASVLFDVSWMSYVPALVEDPRHYVEASSKLAMSSSAADIAGPALLAGHQAPRPAGQSSAYSQRRRLGAAIFSATQLQGSECSGVRLATACAQLRAWTGPVARLVHAGMVAVSELFADSFRLSCHFLTRSPDARTDRDRPSPPRTRRRRRPVGHSRPGPPTPSGRWWRTSPRPSTGST
ncbi:MFS transporter [Kribbella qitaiheensis]|uniref:MFS transporter n=1 Tax=Kribbella qitaiheensis TaxID=1544730 RepID=UPI001FECE3A5|nr:MFS transporter [Kribbella qitaiheensis]